MAGKWIKRAVFALSVLCFAWVLWPLLKDGQELRESLRGGGLLKATAISIPGYALLAVFLALGWWWLAGIYGKRTSIRTGYSVYSRSQLAKYLPGNAFQYVSRQVMGREAGLSHPALVASGLLELGSLMLSAVLLATIALYHARAASAGFLDWPWVLALSLGALLLWPGLDLVLRRVPLSARFMVDLPHLSPLRTLRLLGPSLLCHLFFFLGAGAILIALFASVRGEAMAAAWRLLWVFPLAWLAGTVSIGAPAGVGVREAVLTLELEPLLGPTQAAAVALALRLVTTGGDVLTAAVGWCLKRRSSPG